MESINSSNKNTDEARGFDHTNRLDKPVEIDKILELQNIFKVKRKAGGLDFFNNTGIFLTGLYDKYSENTVKNTLLFQMISGSTVDDSSYEFDLPNGDIEKFIREA